MEREQRELLIEKLQQTDRQTDKWTEGWMDGWTNRQTDRQTDRNLGNSWAGVSPHCLYPLGVILWLRLVWSLVHETTIPFLGL